MLANGGLSCSRHAPIEAPRRRTTPRLPPPVGTCSRPAEHQGNLRPGVQSGFSHWPVTDAASGTGEHWVPAVAESATPALRGVFTKTTHAARPGADTRPSPARAPGPRCLIPARARIRTPPGQVCRAVSLGNMDSLPIRPLILPCPGRPACCVAGTGAIASASVANSREEPPPDRCHTGARSITSDGTGSARRMLASFVPAALLYYYASKRSSRVVGPNPAPSGSPHMEPACPPSPPIIGLFRKNFPSHVRLHPIRQVRQTCAGTLHVISASVLFHPVTRSCH